MDDNAGMYRSGHRRDPRPHRSVVPSIARLAQAAPALSSGLVGHGQHGKSVIDDWYMHGEEKLGAGDVIS